MLTRRGRLVPFGAVLSLASAVACAPAGLPDEVRAEIDERGGQLSSRDGRLTVYIPPGALDEAVELVISTSETPPELEGPAYRVQPDIDLGVALEVTLRGDIPLDPTATVGAISRAAFEDGRGRWSTLPRIEIDDARGQVTAIDSEISLFYGLMAGFQDVADSDDEVESATGNGEDDTGTVEPDDDAGGDTSVDPTDVPDDDDLGPLSHDADVQPIWDTHCVTGCHLPGGAWPSLRLDAGAYDELVEQPSLVASVPLVEPGSSTGSYLMHKLDGTYMLDANVGGCGCNGSGTLMPMGASEPLPADVRAIVRAWIDQGAPR